MQVLLLLLLLPGISTKHVFTIYKTEGRGGVERPFLIGG